MGKPLKDFRAELNGVGAWLAAISLCVVPAHNLKHSLLIYNKQERSLFIYRIQDTDKLLT